MERLSGSTPDRLPRPEGRPTRVLVADDHDLFRVGLARMLECAPDMELVAQASTGRMAVRLAEELRPDVVLMDMRMPDLDGPSATRLILAANPSLRVLMLTVVSDEEAVAAAVAAGASGYILKDTRPGELLSALRAAGDGSAWVSPLAARALINQVRQRDTAPDAAQDGQLSSREREVLRLLVRGMDNGEIAAELVISPRTAKNHVSSILAKLGVSNRVQAAVYAIRHGLS